MPLASRPHLPSSSGATSRPARPETGVLRLSPRPGPSLTGVWVFVGLVALLWGCEVESPVVPPADRLLPTGSSAVEGAPTELFFSEYVEGSSFNKAVEIFNGTGGPVDLADEGFRVEVYFNGNRSPGTTIPLTGTVASGDVFVLADDGADPAILTVADQTSTSNFFNGDDAVLLLRGDEVIDALGQRGVDPGREWGSGDTSTQDNTLRRLPEVCGGDTTPDDDFDPAAEWGGFPRDTFDGLGGHTVACGAESAPAIVSIAPSDGQLDVAADADLSVSFSEPVEVAPGAVTLTCSISGERSLSSRGGPLDFTFAVEGELTAGESCRVEIRGEGVTDVDTDDPPETLSSDVRSTFTVAGVDVCGAPATPVYTVQGDGPSTPWADVRLSIEGIVVGDYEGPGPNLRGFYVQEEEGDGDVATSDGIFIFNFDEDEVSPGDRVRVTGVAQEFQGQTQLGSGVEVQICGSGSIEPTELLLPFAAEGSGADGTDPEAYEGMLVKLPQTLYVTEHFQLGRFGQVLVSLDDRLFQPTQVAAPGAPALAVAEANARRSLLIDDELQNQNPDPIRFGRGGNSLSATNTLRGGDQVTGAVGVLTFTWAGNRVSGNAYRLRPVGALGGGVPEFVPANPRPTRVPEVGGDLKVASFNVLNFFNTFDGCTAGVGGEIVGCRGADDALELERQAAKIVSAIATLESDVIGLIELENDGYGPGSAIAELVDRLNREVGAGTWAFIDVDAGTGRANALGVDAIKVGLIYRSDRVASVGTTAALNTARFVTGGDGEPRNRPALAQAFETPSGARFIAVVNHFKSKGSPCGVADAGDGQGNCNVVRTVAAEELAAWIASDPTGTGDPDILITGDLNAYAQEDPIRALRDAGFQDLLDRDQGAEAYTFVFSGQWGYLDYALASASMSTQVTGAATYLINSDEPLTLDYNLEFKSPSQQELLYAPDAYRSSDHDPVVVGLDLVEPWDFGGFRFPFRAFPHENRVRAGWPLLLRFSLGGDRGLDIFAPGSPVSYPVDCTTREPVGDRIPARTVRDRGPRYTRLSGRYRYFWQTHRAWKGQCRVLDMRFREGTTAQLLVRFR